MTYEESVKLLGELIKECSSIVFFGGAGVSTESGIADYRSTDGLYHQKFKYPPETMLSSEFFYSNCEEFYDFYRAKLLAPDARPNVAHIKLAELESEGKLKAVITQNIDGLHQMAGSKNVYELHGSVYRNRCLKCGKRFGLDKILSCEGIPKCDCGGIIKPDVVLYGESLDNDVLQGSLNAISNADMLIIGGTSLAVYPAASLIHYFGGSHLVVLNRDPTPADSMAKLVIQGKIGEILSQC